MKTRITKIAQTTIPNAQGQLSAAIQVEYYVGTHGPFVEVFPKLGFTAQAVNDKLNELATHITTLAPAATV